MLETPKNHNDQTLIDQQTRSAILKQVMMLKSWIAENLTVTLRAFEYQYISKALLDETGIPYTNRDLFDLQLWAEKVPEFPGRGERDKCDFDEHIENFMNKVGLNWDYWGRLTR